MDVTVSKGATFTQEVQMLLAVWTGASHSILGSMFLVWQLSLFKV